MTLHSVESRHDSWPTSPLQAVGRAFELLTAPPSPLTFDGIGFAGLPQRPLDLPTLRRVLLSPALTPPQRDAVWRALVARARQDTAPTRVWTILAVGLALPGLTRVAGRLARDCPTDVADLDAEILAGFLLRLQTLDLVGQRVLGRLLDAATRAGRRARADAGDVTTVRVNESWSAPPTQPWAHPDWVLARAVAAGVLDRTEACLIGATRLEDVSIRGAALALEVDVATALAWRKTAELRLADAIGSGELDHVRVEAPHAFRAPKSAAALVSRRPAHVGHPHHSHHVRAAASTP
jgi:hypothetical protein